ncbi:MAG: ribosome biogenesis GTPase Der [Nitrospiraceae bacterium]|nr:MAG: ribosome biogenesis GTPase Der [Nitrospiraceae bacterium]
MGRSIVAIVGRPNVGKSTLFNRIVGKRRAVIEDFPGVTRDRLYGEAAWRDKPFFVVDTGGFLQESDAADAEGGLFSEEVRKQIFFAVEEADAVILVMDGESGLLPGDTELIGKLRRFEKKVFFAVNKIDGPKKERDRLGEFYSLGVDLFPLSALNGYGFEEMMDGLALLLPAAEQEKTEYPRIAIVGRPNVGKSTLVNALLSRERMIVSPVPGTTRDAVDSVCTYYGRNYVLIDTAGVRSKGKMARTAERYSFMRTVRNIEESDVTLIVLDAAEGVVELDQKIAGFVSAAKKGAIILVNKWDLVDKEALSADAAKERIYETLWFMRHVPVMTISALSKKRVTKIFPLVDEIIAEGAKRISTHDLNAFLKKALSVQSPPLYQGRPVKIYYMTQVKTSHPRFVLFTNRKEGIREQYIKFIEKQLRECFAFTGVPVEIFVRQRTKT